METAREQTISLRWIIPFLQVTGLDPRQIAPLAKFGPTPLDFTDPHARLPHRIVLKLLEKTVTVARDPALGLKAGQAVDAASLDVVVLAARSCATLLDGLACANRYLALFDESMEGRLVETPEGARWQLSTALDRPEVDDFVLAAAYTLACQAAARRVELLAVHIRHPAAGDLATYSLAFGNAGIQFGRAHNALVFSPNSLHVPLIRAHPGLQAVYELRANALLERLAGPTSIRARVRELVAMQLRRGDASMATVARMLGLSVPTLRRRLHSEDQVFSHIVDDVRRELAEEYLANAAMPIVEIAKVLGFSHVATFYRAFRRWFRGTTPARMRAGAGPGRDRRASPARRAVR